MWSKLTKIRKISLTDWIEIIRLCWLLFVVDIRLRTFPIRWNREWLMTDRSVDQTKVNGLCLRLSSQYIELLGLITNRFRGVRMNCLRRSLALRARLSRAGIRTSLVYGAVKTKRGETAIHSWLEMGHITLDAVSFAIHYERFE